MTTLRRDLFRLLEAGIVGLFFVQAVRFLYATLYAHLTASSLTALTNDPAALIGQPGVISFDQVQLELLIAGGALLIPLLYVVIGRLWIGPVAAAVLVAAGRVFMTANGTDLIGIAGAAVCVGAGLLYAACIAVQAMQFFPVIFILGFGLDQLIRLAGNTLDATWNVGFLTEQTIFSLALFLIAVLTTIFDQIIQRSPDADRTRRVYGTIGFWGAFGFGAILFLEFAVLGLPNMLGHKAGVEYISVAPLLIAVTLLPLVGGIRNAFGKFIQIFDRGYRGYIYFLIMALLVIVGLRIGGAAGVAALLVLQFLLMLALYWIPRISASRWHLTGFAVILGAAIFLLFTGADFLTYEYAFIRGIQAPYGDLLRAFRGLGIGVLLIAVLCASLPIIVIRKRVPWRGSGILETIGGLIVVTGGVAAAFFLSQPIVSVPPPTGSPLITVASLNLHSGYSLYYGSNLTDIAEQLKRTGAQVILLQEVDAGRLTSGGVDQAAWLARTLEMQVSYYPTNEGLQGIAILSQLPISNSIGALLTSRTKQTGVQFVRVTAPDGRPIDIYNTQLSLIFRTANQSIEELEQDQDIQIGEIFTFFNQNGSLTGRLVLGGTFNHTPGTKIYSYLGQQQFIDPLAGAIVERAVTLRLINSPPARVDYVWLYCPRSAPAACLTPFGGNTTVTEYSSHNIVVVGIQLTP